MSAAKLVDLQDGLQVFASSGIETRFMQEKIFQLGCYQSDLPPGSLVIDAGAHIGMFTLYVKLQHPDAEVLAFEPVPETASVLRQNIELHGLDGVVVHETALGSKAESDVKLTYFPALPGNSTRFPEQKGAAKAALARLYSDRVAERLYRGRDITVPVERLSDHLSPGRPIDLLKIDVQGSELEVLLGIDAEHWPLIANVIMEVQDHDNRLATVSELLREHGLKPSAERAPLLDDDLFTYLVRAVRD